MLRFLYFIFLASESSWRYFFSLCRINGRERNKVNVSLSAQSGLNEHGNRTDVMSPWTQCVIMLLNI